MLINFTTNARTYPPHKKSLDAYLQNWLAHGHLHVDVASALFLPVASLQIPGSEEPVTELFLNQAKQTHALWLTKSTLCEASISTSSSTLYYISKTLICFWFYTEVNWCNVIFNKDGEEESCSLRFPSHHYCKQLHIIIREISLPSLIYELEIEK